jgi:hypothetical protein
VYNNLNSNKFALPKLESFTEALKGFLKEKGLIRKHIDLIDFSMSSNPKDFGIDLTTTILYNSLVAHGEKY